MDAKTLCLGALQFGDASGYEIKKMFEDGLLGHLHEASFGSIYPALTRLEEDGLATATAMAQDKPEKLAGAIPSTVKLFPLRTIARPTMDGSPPKRRCQ